MTMAKVTAFLAVLGFRKDKNMPGTTRKISVDANILKLNVIDTAAEMNGQSKNIINS